MNIKLQLSERISLFCGEWNFDIGIWHLLENERAGKIASPFSVHKDTI
jgi:hypothetical protein